MKTNTQQKIKEAKEYCKKLRFSTEAYKESMLYAKFGAQIGIKKCAEIAKTKI